MRHKKGFGVAWFWLLIITGGLALSHIANATTSTTSSIPSSGGDVGDFGYVPLGAVDPRNSAFGAVGDGVTDDTAALTLWWNYARAHGNRVLYLPSPSNCYKVSSSLPFGNYGGNMEIVGDGRGLPSGGSLTSRICYTSTLTGPVIDAVMNGGLTINGISIVPLNGTLSGNAVGSCVYSTPDTVGGGFVRIYNSYMECGAGPGTNAVAIIGQDLSSVQSSNLLSLGNALVIGNQQGPNTTTSPHYTSGVGYGDTHLAINGSILQSTHSPLELTGICGDYEISNAGGAGYIVMENGGDNTHGIIDLSYDTAGCQGGALNLSGVNIENQSTATGVPVIFTGSNYIGRGLWTGRLQTDPAGVTFQGKAYNVRGNIASVVPFLGSGAYFQSGDLNTSSPTLYTGTPPALFESKITGGWTNNITAASGITANQAFTLCSGTGGGGNCTRFGIGPIGGGGNPADQVVGVEDYTLGGHVRWQDAGTCTMNGGACATINLKGTYYNDPGCIGSWTGSGSLTGNLKMIETGTGGSANWTLAPTSTVATDTAVIRWFCPQW